MTKRNPKPPPFTLPPDQTEGQALAQAALHPAINAAAVVNTYQSNIMGDGVELAALIRTLRADMNKSVAGDLSGLEAMLIGQATALQTIFVSLARRAQDQELQRHFEAFLGLALKAQAQSRATIQAVVDLKFPRQATFVKQANIAHGPQQVNNGEGQSRRSNSRGREKLTQQNELLEENTSGGTNLDTRAAPAPARGNPAMETVETVDRTNKLRGKSASGT